MIAKISGRGFNMLAMTILLALMVGLQQEAAGAAAVWSKEFGKAKPGPVGNGLVVVADPAAAGGQALSMTNTAGVNRYFLEANDIRLAGLATVAVRLRGSGFVSNSVASQLTISAIFRRAKPQKHYDVDIPIQGYRVKSGGYVEFSAPVQLEDEPVDYWFALTAACGDPALPKVELSIDRVEIRCGEKAAAYISRVETDKVAYRPGQPICATVTAINPGKEKFVGKLIGKELVGLDGVKATDERSVTVEAGQAARVELKWKAALPEAGRELSVELVDARKQVIHTATDYYGIAKDPSYLGCMGGGVSVPGANFFGRVQWNGGCAANRIQLNSQPEYFRACHLQRMEFFWWSWCDMAQFIPPPGEEPYLGGSGMYWKSAKMVKEQVRMLKETGATPITYIFACFYGEAGYRLFQQHPEWFMPINDYDMQWRANYKRRFDIEFTPIHDTWFYGMFNPHHPEVRRFIAKRIVNLAKEMGWEGARYDAWDPACVKKGDVDFMGNVLARTDEEADRLSAESLAEIKKLVAKELPDFTWGYNYGSPEENKHRPQALAEKCRGGGWILDENPIVYHTKTLPFHYWDAYRDRMVGYGDHIRQLGGIYDPFAFNRGGFVSPVDQLYQTIFMLIGGSRSYGPQFFGQWGVMAFRYSDVFFNWNLRLQPEKQTVIVVTAPETLWWTTMVLENKNVNGRQQAIVHLVNSPVEKEAAEDKNGEVRAPVTDVVVHCAAQDGRNPVRAWLVTAEALSAADEDKVQAVPLELSPASDGVKVVVPFVRIWKTVVFEY